MKTITKHFGDIPVGAEFSLCTIGEERHRIFTKLDRIELTYLNKGIFVNAYAQTDWTVIYLDDMTPVQLITHGGTTHDDMVAFLQRSLSLLYKVELRSTTNRNLKDTAIRTIDTILQNMGEGSYVSLLEAADPSVRSAKES